MLYVDVSRLIWIRTSYFELHKIMDANFQLDLAAVTTAVVVPCSGDCPATPPRLVTARGDRRPLETTTKASKFHCNELQACEVGPRQRSLRVISYPNSNKSRVNKGMDMNWDGCSEQKLDTSSGKPHSRVEMNSPVCTSWLLSANSPRIIAAAFMKRWFPELDRGCRLLFRPRESGYTWEEKLKSLERIKMIHVKNGGFDSRDSCKQMATSRLHEIVLDETHACFTYRIYPL